jgi:hypothetical protein
VAVAGGVVAAGAVAGVVAGVVAGAVAAAEAGAVALAVAVAVEVAGGCAMALGVEVSQFSFTMSVSSTLAVSSVPRPQLT